MKGDAMKTCIYGMLAALMLVCFGSVADLAEADQGPTMTIVKDGRPMATIVMSPDADDMVAEAVEDLQLYIAKMSGATLPIVDSPAGSGNLILVGRMPAVDALIPDLDEYDLARDGVVIKSFPGKLVITGKSDGVRAACLGRIDCGTPNAVYYFLESLGCRWYMPGDDGEVIPRRPTITISAMDVVSKPDFTGREISSNAAWAAGGKNPEAKVYKEHLKWLQRNRVGKNAYHEGHSMYGLVPKKLFEAHPEYFALVDGKRQANGQICTSNPEVLNVVLRKLGTFLGQGPWKSYPVGHYDSWVWCECQNCQADYGDKRFTYRTGSEARQVGINPSEKSFPNYANGTLKFVNTVAERIEKTHPDCLITYYALYNLQGFPEIKPRDNVLPVMCHIMPSNDAWRRQVENWAKVSKHLFFYGYMGHRMASPTLRLADEIRWCYEHKGLAMILTVQEYSVTNFLPLYLASKALWDTKIDSGEVLGEFYQDYYGGAAEPMRTFWETFDDRTRWGAGRDGYQDCLYQYLPSLTADVAATCRGYLQQASERAGTAVVKRRIATVSQYWRIVELQIQAELALAEWKKNKTTQTWKAAKGALTETTDYINSLKGAVNLRARMSMFRGYLKNLEKEKGTKIDSGFPGLEQ